MRTIVHLSDVHFGRDDPAVVEGVLDDLAGRSPALTVISGDFTQRARKSQYRAAAAFLEKLPTPQLAIPGNHDLPLYNLFARLLWPRHSYRQFITPDTAPLFVDDEIAVVGIDTTRVFSPTWDGFWKDGSISQKQLDKVTAQLLGVPKERVRVVVTHHPFVPPAGARVHGIVRKARRALATLETAGVDLLLAGHLHMAYRDDVRPHHEAVKRGMISVQAGTATSDRRRHEPNAYNVITIAATRVEIEVRVWDGKAFTRGAVEVYERADWAGEWKRLKDESTPKDEAVAKQEEAAPLPE